MKEPSCEDQQNLGQSERDQIIGTMELEIR